MQGEQLYRAGKTFVMAMKNTFVFLVFSLLFTLSASAAEWELFAENDEQQYYVDEKSIQCSEVTCSFCTRCCLPSLDNCISSLPQYYVRAWTRKIPKHPEEYEAIEELTFQESACETGMRRMLHRTLIYSDGTSDSVNLNIDIRWDSITTHTIFEPLQTHLCSLFPLGCPQNKGVEPVKPVVWQMSGAALNKRVAAKPEERTTEQLSEGVAEQPGASEPEEKIRELQLAAIEPMEEPAEFSEESGLFRDIYFNFDKYDIKPEGGQVIATVSAWLLQNPTARISVEGHCDERGTNEYNLALGDRRANSAKDFLIALGVASNRIDIVGYGEEKPQCVEQTEECWAKNRRVHFVVLR